MIGYRKIKALIKDETLAIRGDVDRRLGGMATTLTHVFSGLARGSRRMDDFAATAKITQQDADEAYALGCENSKEIAALKTKIEQMEREGTAIFTVLGNRITAAEDMIRGLMSYLGVHAKITPASEARLDMEPNPADPDLLDGDDDDEGEDACRTCGDASCVSHPNHEEYMEGFRDGAATAQPKGSPKVEPGPVDPRA